MSKRISPYGMDIIKACMAFGLTLGLQLYIIGVLAGGWLDKKLGTTPIFTIIGILIGIFISFYRLVSDFRHAAEAEDARNAAKPKQYIDYAALFDEQKDEPSENIPEESDEEPAEDGSEDTDNIEEFDEIKQMLGELSDDFVAELAEGAEGTELLKELGIKYPLDEPADDEPPEA